MDEHHTIWLKTLPESSETPDLTKSVCLIDHPIKSQKKDSKKKERVKHYEKGYRGILIRLLLTFGCISYYGLSLLPGDIRLYRRKLKEMQQEGIVELLRNNHKKLARLYHFDALYEKYIPALPLGYYGHYNKYCRTNHQKTASTEKGGTSANRVIKGAEIVQMMCGAGIAVFPDLKPSLLSIDTIPAHTICYYTMAELRDYNSFNFKMGPQDTRKNIIASRALGLYLSPGGKYVIYHTGKTAMFWNEASEGQMRYYISYFVNSLCENPHMQGTADNCIIIGNDMDVFVKIFTGTGRTINLQNGYAHKYAIPLNHNGQKMLHRMSRPGWRERLIQEILTDYELVSEGYVSGIECDGQKDNRIAFCFCDGDISRLKRFLNALAWNYSDKANQYELYCYDYQLDFVRAVIPADTKIKLIVKGDLDDNRDESTHKADDFFIQPE